MYDLETLVFELLNRIRRNAPSAFTGIGIILYDAPMRLPVASLGDQTLFRPSLPIQGRDNIARILAAISTFDSPWHDGFHLVDGNAVSLTHLSQFFSPPIELIKASSSSATPIGARQMAALAGSTILSVEYAALVDRTGQSLVFRNGKQVFMRSGH